MVDNAFPWVGPATAARDERLDPAPALRPTGPITSASATCWSTADRSAVTMHARTVRPPPRRDLLTRRRTPCGAARRPAPRHTARLSSPPWLKRRSPAAPTATGRFSVTGTLALAPSYYRRRARADRLPRRPPASRTRPRRRSATLPAACCASPSRRRSGPTARSTWPTVVHRRAGLAPRACFGARSPRRDPPRRADLGRRDRRHARPRSSSPTAATGSDASTPTATWSARSAARRRRRRVRLRQGQRQRRPRRRRPRHSGQPAVRLRQPQRRVQRFDLDARAAWRSSARAAVQPTGLAVRGHG